MSATEILIPDPFGDVPVCPSTLMDFRLARDLRARLATELMLDLDDVVTVYDSPNDMLTFTLGANPDPPGPLGYHQVRRHGGRWFYCCDHTAGPAECAFLIESRPGGEPLTDTEAIDKAAALVLGTYRGRLARADGSANRNDNPGARTPHCPA
jgi:hypothetical protein